MRFVIPDPVSLNPQHPVHRRNRCVKALTGTPGGPGPVQPRVVTVPGNVSMYDHLQAVKATAEAALEVPINWGTL